MCGIVAYSNNKPANPDKLSMLLYMNSEKRGGDNMGIYSKENGLIKSVYKAEEFLIKNTILETNMFIGHARKGSVGNKQEKNAHPFKFDNILGVHNGTLENHWPMCTEHGYKTSEYDVDSQVLYKLMDDDSKEELEDEKGRYKTLTKFIGAAALVFTDLRDENTLYAYRTIDRPLYYGEFEGGLYISSLEESLKLIGCKDVKYFIHNNLYKITDGKIVYSEHYKQAEKPKSTVNRFGINNTKDNDYYDTCDWSGYHDKESTNKSLTTFVKNAAQSNVASMANYNTVDLKGRWVQAIADFKNRTYSGNPQIVNVTKDEWYFVVGYNSKNNIDVEIVDDAGETVYINKYLIKDSSLEYKGFGYITNDLVKTTDKSHLFSPGDIVEIVDPTIIKGKIELMCKKTNTSYNIDVSFVRQASVEEMKSIEDDKENEEYKNQFATSNQKDEETDLPFDNEIGSFFGNNNPSTTPPTNSITDAEIIQEDEESEQEDVSYETYSTVIGVIEDGLKDLKDIISSINNDELTDRFGELYTTVTQCRDVKYVESQME